MPFKILSAKSFTLKVLQPFSARGTIVNGADYLISRKTLDFYLISGVVVDYDRSRLIDTLWVNWGNSLNATHVQEEKILYSQIYWVNFTKSGNSYFGTATLPKLSEGSHNATIWVRAEQDQVTTYIPFWAAFSKTVTFTNQVDTPIPSSTANPTQTPANGSAFSASLVTVGIVFIIVVTIVIALVLKKNTKNKLTSTQSFL